MVVTINGGSSNLHMISLNDMRKISDNLQKISYNYEFETRGSRDINIYIQANKAGSFEILLGLIDPVSMKTVTEGLMGAFFYDLVKKMKEYLDSDTKKEDIKKLVDETFKLALELAEAEYFDVKFEQKKQTIAKNTKLINAELSNYQSMKQIASIIGQESHESSLKPLLIEFNTTRDEEIEILEIDTASKELLDKNELQDIKVKNIIISGIPDNLSRSSKSFYMEVAFIGRIKVRATDKQLSKVSDYFKATKSIRIEIEPIIKMGELTETRDARLVKIIEG